MQFFKKTRLLFTIRTPWMDFFKNLKNPQVDKQTFEKNILFITRIL